MYPTNRPLNILLSHIWYEALHNRKKALDVLGSFIQAKLHAGDKDDDLATAYWNSANYYEFDYRETKQPDSRVQAIHALRETLKASPAYRLELLKDEDFAELLKSDEGKKLIADFPGSDGR